MSTSKYPPLQIEQIKNIIIDCQIRRLTNMETHSRLRGLGIDISISTIKNYKTQIRSQAGSWIAKLAKSKRGDYIAQYRERVQEIEAVQKMLWNIIEDRQTGQRTKVEACGKLLDCTDHLLVVYDAMPVVNAMSDYIDGGGGGGMKGKESSFNSNSNFYGVTGGNGDEERDFRTPV